MVRWRCSDRCDIWVLIPAATVVGSFTTSVKGSGIGKCPFIDGFENVGDLVDFLLSHVCGRNTGDGVVWQLQNVALSLRKARDSSRSSACITYNVCLDGRSRQGLHVLIFFNRWLGNTLFNFGTARCSGVLVSFFLNPLKSAWLGAQTGFMLLCCLPKSDATRLCQEIRICSFNVHSGLAAISSYVTARSPPNWRTIRCWGN